MIRFLRELPIHFEGIVVALTGLRQRLDTLLERTPHRTTTDDALTLIRHQLGSIALSDVPRKEPEGEARRAYCAKVSALYDELKPVVEELVRAQIEYGIEKSANWDQVVYARGTVNGLALVLERFEKYHLEHLADIQPKEPASNPHHPFPEI